MSATGLPVFDETIQQTNSWLREVMNDLGPDRQRAYRATRAVLRTLRDRLVLQEAAHLGAQLPMLLRGVYYEGWKPTASPTRERSRDEFLQKVAGDLRDIPPVNVEAATRAVFRTIGRHVTEGQVGEVRAMLPEDIRSLWPES